MIISFRRNIELKITDVSADFTVGMGECAFDSDFMIGFEGHPGHTLVYLSTGHIISVPDSALREMTPNKFRQSLQDDLVGRANKRHEQAGQAVAHTVAVQQYNRLVGEVMGTIKKAQEEDEGPTP